ncbi:SWEET sugar transporter [Cynara cardunculus var. scolymus]|uniref:Bidirectional sugar transporter SWEET n=1 Tax=Cynara cardunculus var. scolymus TaxID=59895 RepID=A0A103XY05_CYNCS|nr:SWEET sugar transporter [Cynara cardunculus var. scolymus]
MVYLAPAPTFYRIVNQRSTEGFQSLPYVVALFSSMIWIYYATLKTDATLLITINTVGCVIETLYIAIYIAYAPKNLVVSLNFVGFWVIALSTHYLAEGPTRAEILGWICLVISVSVYAAPLSIMRKVIQTKSVEFMPFGLSFFLVLSAIMWFFYGLLQKDIYIALPNIIGFILGVLQIVLYLVYKNSGKKTSGVEEKLPTSVPTFEARPVCSTSKHDANREINIKDQTVTLKCIKEEDIESRISELPSGVCRTEPPNDSIEDVVKEDVILEASTGCTSMVQPVDAFSYCNKRKSMEPPNQVYLIESGV